MNMMKRAAGLPPGIDEFKWPAPPYLEFLPGQDDLARKQCLVVLDGGRKLQGELLHFNPDAAVMDLDIAGGPGGFEPKFAEMVQLRLLRPLRLKRQELPPEFAKEKIFAVSERQTFSIEMHDGEIFSGETRGFVNAQCGLFLFPPAGIDQVTRYFVPAHRIKDFHIGDPIGQILIKHNIATKGAVAAAVARQRELRVQKLGDLMTVNQIVSADELAAALAHQERGPIHKLGEVLVEMGLLTLEELGTALKEQERNRKVPLGQLDRYGRHRSGCDQGGAGYQARHPVREPAQVPDSCGGYQEDPGEPGQAAYGDPDFPDGCGAGSCRRESVGDSHAR